MKADFYSGNRATLYGSLPDGTITCAVCRESTAQDCG